jgi:hypothetical protein
MLERLRIWWFQQSATMKWGVAVVALLAISVLWRLVGGIVMELVSAILLAVFIWIVLNLTRPFWQEIWGELAAPIFAGDVPDLALLLAALPLASWTFSLVLRALRVRR